MEVWFVNMSLDERINAEDALALSGRHTYIKYENYIPFPGFKTLYQLTLGLVTLFFYYEIILFCTLNLSQSKDRTSLCP